MFFYFSSVKTDAGKVISRDEFEIGNECNVSNISFKMLVFMKNLERLNISEKVEDSKRSLYMNYV